MRRVLRSLPSRPLLRASRRSSRRRAHRATRVVECPLAGLLSPRLRVSQQSEPAKVVYHARLGLRGATSDGSAALARAFTSVVVCASATEAEGDAGNLRQAVWTDRTGNMVLELRSASSTLSASRVAGIVLPVLEGYAAGSLEAARVVRGSDTVRMAMDAARTELANGGVLVRVVLYGRDNALAASAHVNRPAAPVLRTVRRLRYEVSPLRATAIA
jgi:hypothetical protein